MYQKEYVYNKFAVWKDSEGEAESANAGCVRTDGSCLYVELLSPKNGVSIKTAIDQFLTLRSVLKLALIVPGSQSPKMILLQGSNAISNF